MLYIFFRLVLRIATDDLTSAYQLSVKFGAEVEACRDLIDAVRNMGLDMVGIRCVIAKISTKCNRIFQKNILIVFLFVVWI